jgi:hypothetical protein
MAMETALLGCTLPVVAHLLQDLLRRRGYQIESDKDHPEHILAYQAGSWFRSPRRVEIHLLPVGEQTTRVEVTVEIESRKRDEEAEEILEEKIIEAICKNYQTTLQKNDGLR